MKLSAFLAVSVPIMAASQAAAVAADGGSISGTWLQESISELAPAKAKMSQTSYAAAQTPKRAVAHAAPTASSINLRPFKAGRYLPSEKELRAAAMQAQQARYDYSVDQPQAAAGMLSGNVTSQYAIPQQRQASIYDQFKMAGNIANSMPVAQRIKTQVKHAIGQRAPQAVPGHQPMVPAQLAQNSQMVHQIIPEPPSQRRQIPASMPIGQFPQPPMMQQQMPMQQMPMHMQQPMMQSMQMQQMQMQQQFQQMQMQQQMQQQMQMQMQQQPTAFQQPEFSPQQMADMYRQVEMNPPTARMNFNGEVVGQAMGNPANGIGQPPFPLNLFGGSPMSALSRPHHAADVAPARFGSWHGGSQLAAGGFHSYVSRRRSSPYEYSRAPVPATKRVNKVAKRSIASAPPAVAAKQKPIVAATYPTPYQSYRAAY